MSDSIDKDKHFVLRELNGQSATDEMDQVRKSKRGRKPKKTWSPQQPKSSVFAGKRKKLKHELKVKPAALIALERKLFDKPDSDTMDQAGSSEVSSKDELQYFADLNLFSYNDYKIAEEIMADPGFDMKACLEGTSNQENGSLSSLQQSSFFAPGSPSNEDVISKLAAEISQIDDTVLGGKPS